MLAEKSVADDLELYQKMLGDDDHNRIINELLKYALKKDVDFQDFKKQGQDMNKQDGGV